MTALSMTETIDFFGVERMRKKYILKKDFDVECIETITKVSFFHLIEEKEKKGFPYILAYVESKKKQITPYDAVALDKARRAHLFKKICPEKIKKIYYYTIQSVHDEYFTYIGSVDRKSSPQKDWIYFLLALNQVDTPEGKYRLGTCYESGKSVRIDRKKAYEFYKESALQGHALSALKMARKFDRDIEDKSSNAKKVFFYCKIAADSGSGYAQYEVGKFYSKGLGTHLDDVKAFEYYAASAKNKYVLGLLSLGNCYKSGRGTQKNLPLAVKYFTKAAAKENIQAIHSLAMCYLKGAGIAKDFKEAYRLFFIAANAGILSAQCNLGRLYEYGLGIEKNTSLAVFHYKKAAEVGSISALYRLGRCYEHGIGVERDRRRSHIYYRQASYLGHERALKKIDTLDFHWFK